MNYKRVKWKSDRFESYTFRNGITLLPFSRLKLTRRYILSRNTMLDCDNIPIRIYFLKKKKNIRLILQQQKKEHRSKNANKIILNFFDAKFFLREKNYIFFLRHFFIYFHLRLYNCSLFYKVLRTLLDGVLFNSLVFCNYVLDTHTRICGFSKQNSFTIFHTLIPTL